MIRLQHLLLIIAMLSVGAVVGAQVPDRFNRPPRGGGGGGGPWNFKNLDEVKAKITATDEEWKVIGPKLRKVVQLRDMIEADRDQAAANLPGALGAGNFVRGMFRGGPGGPGGGGGGPFKQNPLTQAQTELQTALKDPNTTSEEIDEKLAALRAARARAKADLAAAQQDLLPLLTADQEAILVNLGHLD